MYIPAAIKSVPNLSEILFLLQTKLSLVQNQWEYWSKVYTLATDVGILILSTTNFDQLTMDESKKIQHFLKDGTFYFNLRGYT